MKITKATSLSIQVRPYRWRGESRIGLSLLVLVDAAEITPVLETETVLWEVAKTKMDCSGVLEYGIPKVNPEFLVSGFAFSAFSEDKTQLDVTVEVNDKRRVLRVFGDRQYQDKKITEPRPFTEVSMGWANSYGGGQFVNNPEGKAWLDMNSYQASEAVAMPNVENPDHLLQDPTKEHVAYNFGAQDLTWPIRFSKIGNYSEEWKKTDFPGFFPDMDPAIFNAAQAEQVWPERTELPANSEFVVTNMHPKKPIWKGTVPAWRGRCLLQMQKMSDDEPMIQEAFLKLKTLWLIPHLDKYVLIFQDSVPCWYEDGSEIKHVLAALEWAHSPKEQAHYLAFMAQREDTAQSALLAYSDEDLLPENVQYHGLDPKPGPLGAMSEKLHKLQHYMHNAAREHISAMGLDANDYLPEQVGPQPRPDLRYLPEQQRWQDQRIEQLREHLDEVKEARQRHKLTQGLDTEFNELTGADELYEQLRQDADKIQSDPEMLDKTTLSRLKQLHEQQAPHEDPRLQILEKRMWSITAHFDNGRYVLSNQAAQQGRTLLLKKIAEGASLEGLNLQHADLSDLEFSNLDFSFVVFKQADLRGAVFENCRFHESAFSFAQLAGTEFRQCQFESGNFNQTHFKNVCFEECDFSKMIAYELSFEACEFSVCTIRESIWQYARLTDSHFSLCSADGFSWLHNQVENCHFKACEWSRCALTESHLKQVDFDDNYLFRMAMTYVQLEQVSFESSWMEALSLISDQVVRDVDFSDSYIKHSCLRNLTYQACRFDRAIIENSDFSLSVFSDISAVAMELPDAVFMRTRFVRADFSGSNLSNATFTHAEFAAVNFTHVNFFRCEMAHTVIKSDCIEHENYLEQIQLEPSQREVSDGV